MPSIILWRLSFVFLPNEKGKRIGAIAGIPCRYFYEKAYQGYCYKSSLLRTLEGGGDDVDLFEG
jgi:hypothetical protein